MNRRIRRIMDAVTKEGGYAFRYLVKEQMKERWSEQKKYDKWRRVHEKELYSAPLGTTPTFTVLMENERLQEDSAAEYAQDEILYETIDIREKTLEELSAQIKGTYVLVVAPGYVLAKAALKRIAACLEKEYHRGKMFWYADCDETDADGNRSNPWFRPEYSIDTLRAFPYMEGVLILKKELLDKLVFAKKLPVTDGGYFAALEASFLLKPEQFGHIAQILSHRRSDAEAVPLERRTISEQQLEWKRQLFAQYGIHAELEPLAQYAATRQNYFSEEEVFVSIIIPSKDNPEMFEACLKSLELYTVYKNYEIILVDNGSSEENRRRYEQICGTAAHTCTYVYEPMEFNFSRMCNLGAKRAKGDCYLFLNDDIECVEQTGCKDWLATLVGQALQPHTGAVGVKLLYPDTNLIQHDGVVNYESGATHIFSRMPDDVCYEHGRNRLDYNYSAVTAACMVLEREKFERAGGFEERLAVAFNDVELCFKLLENGYVQIVRNDVVFYHHESVTRGDDAVSEEKFLRNLAERERLFALHPDMVKRDAYYSRYLTQKAADASVTTAVVRITAPVEEIVRSAADESTPESDGKPVVHLYAVQRYETTCIRGYAYMEAWKKNDKTLVDVVLQGRGRTYRLRTQKVYNGTLAKALHSSKPLSFAEFCCYFSEQELPDDVYTIGIRIRKRAGAKPYTVMTNQTLVCGQAME